MKTELSKIAQDLEKGTITDKEVRKLLLGLLGVNGSALLSKARQMRLEQQRKIDSYTEYYNEYEIGTLNGIDRIVKLIKRHYHKRLGINEVPTLKN